MQAGKLRKYVTVQALPTAPVGRGDVSTAWSDVFDTYMDLEPKSGRELWASQGIQNPASHTATMRFDVRLTAKMRIRLIENGVTRYFNIQSRPRNTEGRNEEMVMDVTEDVNVG